VIMMMMDDVIRTCMVFLLIGTSTYIYIYILTQLVLDKRTGAYLLLPGGENGAEIFCFLAPFHTRNRTFAKTGSGQT
jgi:hypothetical protein